MYLNPQNKVSVFTVTNHTRHHLHYSCYSRVRDLATPRTSDYDHRRYAHALCREPVDTRSVTQLMPLDNAIPLERAPELDPNSARAVWISKPAYPHLHFYVLSETGATLLNSGREPSNVDRDAFDSDTWEYIGHLPPDAYTFLTQHNWSPPMDALEEQLWTAEATRGPRVTVTRHDLKVDTLDVTTVTYDQIKALEPTTLEYIEGRSGVNIRGIDEPSPLQWVSIRLALLAAQHTLHERLDFTEIALPSVDTAYTTCSHVTIYNLESPAIGVHYSPLDGRLIKYYASWDHFFKGRISMAKAGKVIAKFAERLGKNERWVKTATNQLYASILPTECELLADTDAIVEAYLEGPSSCVAKRHDAFHLLQEEPDLHPAQVYGGDSDVRLAVARKDNQVIARTLVNTRNNRYPRIYCKEGYDNVLQDLKAWLADQGYEYHEYAMCGARLNYILTDEDHLVLPYIDNGNPASLIIPEQELIVVGAHLSDFETHGYWEDPLINEAYAVDSAMFIQAASHDQGGINERYLYSDHRVEIHRSDYSGNLFLGSAVEVLDDMNQLIEVSEYEAQDHFTLGSMFVWDEREERFEYVRYVSERTTPTHRVNGALMNHSPRLRGEGHARNETFDFIATDEQIERLNGVRTHDGLWARESDTVLLDGTRYFKREIMILTGPDGRREYLIAPHGTQISYADGMELAELDRQITRYNPITKEASHDEAA